MLLLVKTSSFLPKPVLNHIRATFQYTNSKLIMEGDRRPGVKGVGNRGAGGEIETGRE